MSNKLLDNLRQAIVQQVVAQIQSQHRLYGAGFMNKENKQRLFLEFPQLYREAIRHQSILSYGITCGNGWFQLIYELSREIEQVAEKVSLEGEGYPCLIRAKEKYGSLRYHVRIDERNPTAKHFMELVREAENKSKSICETCGKPGAFIDDGWMRIRCEICEEDIQARNVIARGFLD